MAAGAPRPKIGPGDIVWMILVFGSIGGGIALRFQPAPLSILGGGLIFIGVVLFAYWAKRPPPPDSPSSRASDTSS